MRVATTLRDARTECPRRGASGLSPRGAHRAPVLSLQSRPGPRLHTGRLSSACRGSSSTAGARAARPERAAPWRWGLEIEGAGKPDPGSLPALGADTSLSAVGVVGWREARSAHSSSGPTPSPPRSCCLRRGAHCSASLLAFPRGSTQTLNFSGVQNLRRLLLPTAPALPPDAGSLAISVQPGFGALSRSQLGRAERRASPGCGRQDLGSTPGAGEPGARAAGGQGGGS